MPSSLPPVRLGRHVQLLLDDGGAAGGQPDHERDHPQVARLRQHPQRLGAADTALLVRPRAARRLAAGDDQDDDAAHAGQRAALTSRRLMLPILQISER